MFRLKLISEPKMMKLKCNFSFPNIVLANLEEKNVVPTKQQQEIVADVSYDGLSKVTIEPIPDEYIIPSGELEIKQNGTYDVVEKANAIVNVPEPVLISKTINENGTYKAEDDNVDGYSEVIVATSGVDIYNYFQKNVEGNRLISNIIKCPSIDFGTDRYKNGFFLDCIRLKEIENMNMTNVVNIFQFFSNCQSLETIPELDWSNIQGIGTACFSNCNSLTNLGGFNNVGNNYYTFRAENYDDYTIDIHSSNLVTEQSMINIFNKVADINTKGVKPQKIIVGSTNLAKLTSEEGQQALVHAQNYGWTIS